VESISATPLALEFSKLHPGAMRIPGIVVENGPILGLWSRADWDDDSLCPSEQSSATKP
jgi:hypothetical protein